MFDEHPADGRGFRPGSVLAGYRLEEEVGRGGMAVVYRASEARLSRLVALKIFAPQLPADSALQLRFTGEAVAAAAVDHPNITTIYSAGEAAGVLYIAMRFVPGGDLRRLIEREGTLEPLRVLDIVSQVAAALDAAHEAGLVHRDVKPGNILVDTVPGKPDSVLLSDFGISKRLSTSMTLTAVGHFPGTPAYSAPEQIQDHGVDGRTDQYALACVTYELFTGRQLFESTTEWAWMNAHVHDRPPMLTARRPDLPENANAVLAKALAKFPAERYATCADFADTLRGTFGLPPYHAGRSFPFPVRWQPWPATSGSSWPATSESSWPTAAAPADPVSADPVSADPLAADPAPADSPEAEPVLPAPPEPGAPVSQPAWFRPADWVAPTAWENTGEAEASDGPATREPEAAPAPAAEPALWAEPAPWANPVPDMEPLSEAGLPWETPSARQAPTEPRPAPASSAPTRPRRVPLPRPAPAVTPPPPVVPPARPVTPTTPPRPASRPPARPRARRRLVLPLIAVGAAVVGALVALPFATRGTGGTASPPRSTNSAHTSTPSAVASLPATVALPAGFSGVPVTSLAVSPSGNQLAIAGYNNTCLLDIATRQCTALLSGAWAVAFGPDGGTLAGTDVGDTLGGAIQLWSTATGQPVNGAMTDPASRGANSAAVSPDGKTLAVGDLNGNVYRWDLATRTQTTLRPPGSTEVRSVAYSPNGEFLAVGDDNGSAYVYRLATKTWITLSDPDGEAVNAVAFSADSSMLVAGDDDGQVYLGSTVAGTVIAHFGVAAGKSVLSLAFSPNGALLAVGDENGVAYLWNVRSRTLVKSLPTAQAREVTAVAFGHQGTDVVTGNQGGSVEFWPVG